MELLEKRIDELLLEVNDLIEDTEDKIDRIKSDKETWIGSKTEEGHFLHSLRELRRACHSTLKDIPKK